MIPVGNKIAVIASSARGKGAKIRKGSLGYVSTIGAARSVGIAKLVRGAMYIVPARIVFTRFGYEDKPRNEVKFVALVYPTVETKEIKNKKAYLHKLVKQALDYTEEIKNIFNIEGIKAKKITTLAVSSLNTTTKVTSNENEYIAWFRSIALSGILHNILYCPKNDAREKLLHALINGKKDNKTWLQASIASRKSIEFYVNKLFTENKKEMKALVLRLQEVLQLAKLGKLHDIKIHRVPAIRGGGTTFSTCWLLHTLGMEHHINTIIKDSFATKRIKNLSKEWLSIYNGITKKSI